MRRHMRMTGLDASTQLVAAIIGRVIKSKVQEFALLPKTGLSSARGGLARHNWVLGVHQ